MDNADSHLHLDYLVKDRIGGADQRTNLDCVEQYSTPAYRESKVLPHRLSISIHICDADVLKVAGRVVEDFATELRQYWRALAVSGSDSRLGPHLIELTSEHFDFSIANIVARRCFLDDPHLHSEVGDMTASSKRHVRIRIVGGREGEGGEEGHSEGRGRERECKGRKDTRRRSRNGG